MHVISTMFYVLFALSLHKQCAVSAVRVAGRYISHGLQTNPPFADLTNLIESTKILCVLSDIDGTFITDDHKVNNDAVSTIKHLMGKGVSFFPATGRTRSSMLHVTNNALCSLYGSSIGNVPGVYAQGLSVCGADGQMIFERFLEPSIIARVTDYCMRNKLAVIAHAGERIICRQQCTLTDRLLTYSEPLPEVYSPGLDKLESLAGLRVNKLNIIGDEADLQRIRPLVTELFSGEASITKAVPGLLEVLPLGASKGEGVLRLLKHYNIDPASTMAFGDGENDIEMMQAVGLSVAMENAKPALKSVCRATTLSNNENGVGIALHMLLDKMRQ